MTLKEIETTCSFRCARCENLEDEYVSNFLSCKKHFPPKIFVKNIPNGISESGLQNLFITIGKPKTINYFYSSNSAIVEFHSIKEAELSVRDLNCKPPYNLKVTSVDDTNQSKEDKVEETWDFNNPPENVFENLFETETNAEEENEHLKKGKKQLVDFVSRFGYDPSIRMRQRKLDFKTDINCISMGRGYINMGEVDRYIGGLQNFVLNSENSKAKTEVNLICEFCQAPTTKMCGHCFKSYCSKTCLSKSSVIHEGQCFKFGKDNTKQSKEINNPKSNLKQQNTCSCLVEYFFLNGELTSGCTVLMSTYLTMESVFVRKSDKECEEKFTRLCNDVAEFALKDEQLESIPKLGELYIARYYNDLCFYRARVTSVCEKAVDVVFVDFGNSQKTNLKDLKPLPSHLKSVPELAVKVHLSDMVEGSSLESVEYYNKLVVERTPLILEFKEGSRDVILKEKNSKEVVNKIASNYSLPSWKIDNSVISKLGEIFYKNSLTTVNLKVGETYNLIICHFDEKEFLELDVLWVLLPDTDDFVHANSEMLSRITEYCEFLKGDCYLPRVNELCLVKEEGKWHRCINLKSHGTTCCVFFVDDGHSSFVKTTCIRKMIQDFTEAPAQAICCTLPGDSKLKADKELCSKVVKYLKSCVGQTVDSIQVLKLMGDAYCLSIPEIQKMFI